MPVINDRIIFECPESWPVAILPVKKYCKTKGARVKVIFGCMLKNSDRTIYKIPKFSIYEKAKAEGVDITCSDDLLKFLEPYAIVYESAEQAVRDGWLVD